MIALTTAALAVPLALLRRQRVTPVVNWRKYSSQPAFVPPVRRAPPPGAPSAVPPPPRTAPVRTLPISTVTTPSANSGTLFRRPSEPLPISTEDGVNGVLYSLKAFSIATAVVVAGGAASVWGVKTYLGVKDTQEFASAMRLTLRNKWPFLISRIHRTSDSTQLFPPVPPPVTARSGSELGPPDGSSFMNAEPDVKGWNWPEAQARLAAAYERGGVSQFAEATTGELEAELELERRKRGLVDPSADPS